MLFLVGFEPDGSLVMTARLSCTLPLLVPAAFSFLILDFRIAHRDLNRHNFVVDEQSELVLLTDFENADDYSDDKAKDEIDLLRDQLVEDTGRGWSRRFLGLKISFRLNQLNANAFSI